MSPKSPRKRVTHKDVAERAGVSTALVSYVINDRPVSIAPETRTRILQAIEELGYTPSAVARDLRAQRTHTIAFAFLHYEPRDLFADPYLAGVISGLVDALIPAGYYLLTYPVPDTEDAWQEFRTLLHSQRVDGVIVHAAFPNDPLLDLIHEADIPYVALGLAEAVHEESAVVVADDISGVRLVTEHLISKGHERIGHVQGDLRYGSGRLRMETFRAVLQEHGLAVREAWIRGEGWTRWHGLEAMQEILAEPERPTAIVAANDLLALGAMEQIRAQGLRIPKDTAIVGFDDVPFACDLFPPLTTVRLAYGEFGCAAATNILHLIEHPEDGLAPTVIPVRLMVRASA